MKSASERFTRRTLIGLIVRDDEIGDGIEDLDPVPVGLVHAREQAGILQSNRGVSGNRLQKFGVVFLQRLAAIRKTENAHQITRMNPVSRIRMQSFQPRSELSSGPNNSAALPETIAARRCASASIRARSKRRASAFIGRPDAGVP